MKYLDEYRDPVLARQLCDRIARTVTRPWTLMEVCGGQTHAIVKYGIDDLLPEAVELVHGPGCPVCVTPLEQIDRAVEIASRPGVIFCSFGDMLRVPGSARDLFTVKAAGGDVRTVYSPLDCLTLAREHPDKTVVFFAVGFETTAPANAMALRQAKRLGLDNFCALVSQVLVPPAMSAILESPQNRVQAFLGPGHVCTVMGTREYAALVERHRVPVVITGFEPVDLLDGILQTLGQLESGAARLEIQYARAVKAEGNVAARRLIEEVFCVCDRTWRGVGVIAASGLRLAPAYEDFDAERRFDVSAIGATESTTCISGDILRGLGKPPDCPAFGTECTPQTPLGATMVSAEGACAAYYNYGRHLQLAPRPRT